MADVSAISPFSDPCHYEWDSYWEVGGEILKKAKSSKRQPLTNNNSVKYTSLASAPQDQFIRIYDKFILTVV
ncbi:unnamed protein product [Angiostrongylus costaricensis]|uniref:Uncharacterized protein n=1 Tax=Angiostrongylus costaricensis TaxID=334426 RepID=A0A0R3Q148_ANGCS|nr:unnamed protein product [Angiostrongylus costaricensis]